MFMSPGMLAMSADEQAILVVLRLDDDDFGSDESRRELLMLEDEFAKAMADSSAGEYDGHEFGRGSCTFYFYGVSADRLFQALRPLLGRVRAGNGSHVVRRYGGPGAYEKKDDLDSLSAQ
jgi:hypothetical protein